MLLILAFVFSVDLFALAGSKCVVDHLRCEYLENPLGIDRTNSRLSWIMKSKERAEIQTAYEIIVVSTPELLAKNAGDLWASGEVKSDWNTLITYSGRALTSRMCCYWKVRMWDKDGKPSAWSQSAMWSMGLLNPADWQAGSAKMKAKARRWTGGRLV